MDQGHSCLEVESWLLFYTQVTFQESVRDLLWLQSVEEAELRLSGALLCSKGQHSVEEPVLRNSIFGVVQVSANWSINTDRNKLTLCVTIGLATTGLEKFWEISVHLHNVLSLAGTSVLAHILLVVRRSNLWVYQVQEGIWLPQNYAVGNA